MTGVVSKIKQVLQIQALTQVDYFKNAYEKVNQMFENFLKRYTDITEDYNRIKRIVLDYNYQFGRLKALQFMSHKYKEESDRIIEETKLKIKKSREAMEDIDLKLIQSFYSVIQKKRIQN